MKMMMVLVWILDMVQLQLWILVRMTEITVLILKVGLGSYNGGIGTSNYNTGSEEYEKIIRIWILLKMMRIKKNLNS